MSHSNRINEPAPQTQKFLIEVNDEYFYSGDLLQGGILVLRSGFSEDVQVDFPAGTELFRDKGDSIPLAHGGQEELQLRDNAQPGKYYFKVSPGGSNANDKPDGVLVVAENRGSSAGINKHSTDKIGFLFDPENSQLTSRFALTTLTRYYSRDGVSDIQVDILGNLGSRPELEITISSPGREERIITRRKEIDETYILPTHGLSFRAQFNEIGQSGGTEYVEIVIDPFGEGDEAAD